MHEVRGSNPGAAPPTFGQLGAQIHPHTRLKSKGKGFPEEGKVGAKGLWFRRAPLEAEKKRRFTWVIFLLPPSPPRLIFP